MSTTTRRSSRPTSTDLALVSVFAALIAVCAILPALPVGVVGVPFTLQMFGVFLAGAVLGGRRGFLAVVLYLAVGTAGLPIFTQGTGGPAVWAGATAGYLVAFPLAALLVGIVASRTARRRPAALVPVVSVAAAVVTVAVVGTLGTLGMSLRLDVSLREAWTFATPFFVADVLKGIAAAVVAAAVHRAFPRLSVR